MESERTGLQDLPTSLFLLDEVLPPFWYQRSTRLGHRLCHGLPTISWRKHLHGLTFVATLCMFIVHLFLAVAHPLMWQGLVSMRFGVISESYAREHHAKWYFGDKRAREIWKAHLKELKERDEAAEQ